MSVFSALMFQCPCVGLPLGETPPAPDLTCTASGRFDEIRDYRPLSNHYSRVVTGHYERPNRASEVPPSSVVTGPRRVQTLATQD